MYGRGHKCGLIFTAQVISSFLFFVIHFGLFKSADEAIKIIVESRTSYSSEERVGRILGAKRN